MPDDGIDHDALYETVRRAIRDALREAFWDLLTIVIAFLLLAIGLPVMVVGAGGSGPFAWVAVVVGLIVASLGVYRLYHRFWGQRSDGGTKD